jgi:hypothetical protein
MTVQTALLHATSPILCLVRIRRFAHQRKSPTLRTGVTLPRNIFVHQVIKPQRQRTDLVVSFHLHGRASNFMGAHGSDLTNHGVVSLVMSIMMLLLGVTVTPSIQASTPCHNRVAWLVGHGSLSMPLPFLMPLVEHIFPTARRPLLMTSITMLLTMIPPRTMTLLRHKDMLVCSFRCI